MGINLGWKEIHVGVTKCIVLNCRRRTVKKNTINRAIVIIFQL